MKTKLLLLLFITCSTSIYTQTVSSVQSGDWNNPSIWTGGVVPDHTFAVNILANHIVTVNDNRYCASLNFSGSNCGVQINTSAVLTVTGTLTVAHHPTDNTSADISGSGILSCAQIHVGSGTATFSGNTNRTTLLVSSVDSVFVGGNLTLTYRNNSSRNGNPYVNLNDGVFYLSGTITPDAQTSNAQGTVNFRMDQGNQSGKLVLIHSEPWQTHINLAAPWRNGLTTYNVILNGSNAVVVYAANGNQKINREAYSGTITLNYRNLTLAGSGNKTLPSSSAAGVSGILSMQGTALMVNKSPSFGPVSTLEYKGSAIQTSSSIEFPASGGSKNLKIENSNGVVLHAQRNISGVLTLSQGVLQTTSANYIAVTNTDGSSVSGGSANAYVDGPLFRTIADTSSSQVYVFPVGDNNTYLPFTLTQIQTGTTAPLISVEAFLANAGGTPGPGINTLSTTEYWYAEIEQGNYSDGSVSLERQAVLGQFDAIARSLTQSGTYTNLNGTVAGNSITGSDLTGNALGYFVMANTAVACAAPQLNATYNNNDSDTICQGEAFTVAANPTGGSACSGSWEFAWYTGDGSGNTYWNGTTWNNNETWGTFATVNNVSPDSTTTYKVKVRCSADFSCNATDTTGATVTVIPLPPAPAASYNAPVCAGDSLVLSASPISGATYAWTGPSGFIASEQNPLVSSNAAYSMEGTYFVTASVNGCSSPQGSIFVEICTPTNVFEGITSTNSLVNIFPNPFSKFLIIENPESKPLSIVLSDALGNEMTVMENVSNNNLIDCATLPPGMYFLFIRMENIRQSVKLVKFE